MQNTVSLDEIVEMAEHLPLVDRVRLIERLAPSIARELQGPKTARKSLRGLWKGITISDEDIAEVRREMWSGFPRNDV
jgi:hypothetical protein